jgi:membrane protein CcdC involved in cytochrome C biogenesis
MVKITKIKHAIEPMIKSTTVLVPLFLSNGNFLQIVPFLLQDIDMLSSKTSNGRKEKIVFF